MSSKKVLAAVFAIVMCGAFGCKKKDKDTKSKEPAAEAKTEVKKDVAPVMRVAPERPRPAGPDIDKLVATVGAGSTGDKAKAYRAAYEQLKALGKKALPNLRKAILAEKGSVTSWLYLVSLTGKDGIPVLIDAVKHPSWMVHGFAITYLGKQGKAAAAALPRLKELAKKSKNKAIRKSAKKAIKAIQ